MGTVRRIFRFISKHRITIGVVLLLAYEFYLVLRMLAAALIAQQILEQQQRIIELLEHFSIHDGR